MSAQDEVREASGKFYGALNRMANGDAGAMAGIWSHDAAVTTMHPIGGRETGWDAVAKSFAQVAQLATAGEVKLDDQTIQVTGDLAYELGTERGKVTMAGAEVAIEHRVTNVYRRDSGGWKIVHHHTDLSPAMLDLVASLQK